MNYMVTYLTCKRWHSYNLYERPEYQGFGGGMAVKTHRILEALRRRYYTQLTDDVEKVDSPIVVIEPLWFCLFNNSDSEKELHWERLVALGNLRDNGTKLILACSEFELMRWQPEFREGVLKTIDMLTCNCQYQASMFSYFKIKPDAILCDPIPIETFHTPIEDQNEFDVLATGHVSWQKNINTIIDVYKKLQRQGLKTAYIGSSELWGKSKKPDPTNTELEEKLRDVTDFFFKSLSQHEVAEKMRQTRIGLWVSTHECFGQGYAEMLACGRPVVAGKHGLAAERPQADAKATDTAGCALELIQDKKLWAETSHRSSEWVLSNVTYERFLDQFSEVIRRL